LIDLGAPRRIVGPQIRRAVSGREIAQDRLGFPHHDVAVLDHRDLAVRVQGSKGGHVQPAELAPDIDPPIGQTEFLQQPSDLLHIEGGGAPVKGDHGRLLRRCRASVS
jgi:hypothetical protein